MPRPLRHRVFQVLSAVFASAAAFHAAALVRPEIAEPSPPWRHALFVAINAAVALGALFRPRGFVVAFALLTAQQLYSHGALAARGWRDEGRVDWASILVLIGLPFFLGLFVVDARAHAGAPERRRDR